MLKSFFKKLRRKYYYIRCSKGIKHRTGTVHINGKCRFNGNVYLGSNTNFNGMRIKGKGKVEIGNNFHSGQDILVLTSFHNYMGAKIPYDKTVVTKDVTIEDNVWLGDRVIVLGGVTIGEGAIVQAGSVIVSDVEKCAIVGGHPAKKFKSRDIEDYENKKRNKMFF